MNPDLCFLFNGGRWARIPGRRRRKSIGKLSCGNHSTWTGNVGCGPVRVYEFMTAISFKTCDQKKRPILSRTPKTWCSFYYWKFIEPTTKRASNRKVQPGQHSILDSTHLLDQWTGNGVEPRSQSLARPCWVCSSGLNSGRNSQNLGQSNTCTGTASSYLRLSSDPVAPPPCPSPATTVPSLLNPDLPFLTSWWKEIKTLLRRVT